MNSSFYQELDKFLIHVPLAFLTETEAYRSKDSEHDNVPHEGYAARQSREGPQERTAESRSSSFGTEGFGSLGPLSVDSVDLLHRLGPDMVEKKRCVSLVPLS